MKFVLLGDDPACLPLLRAIAHAPQHELALAAHAGELWPQIAALTAAVRPAGNWQALLIEPQVSAAIVAGWDPAILDGARTLARAGTPLIVFPDVRQTSSFVYDLWPLEDDGRTQLIPLFAHDVTGVAGALREALDGSQIGRPTLVQLERTACDRLDNVAPLSGVENALLHDADLLRRLCGNYSRVTSVPVGLTEAAVARLVVKFSGDGLPEATWQFGGRGGKAASRLTITGERDAVTRELSAAPEGGRSGADDDAASGPRLLQFVEQRLSQAVSEPRWSDVVRAFDVVDAARRSIRCARTVEIGSEELSERRQFKSIMTAAGCGVLLYTLLGVVAALLVGAVADPRDAAQRRAASAGFIVCGDEFQAGTSGLTAEGEAHVTAIAARLWETTADVIVEPSGAGADLDALRRATVENALQAAKAANVAGRVVTRPLEGAWFERAMIGVWVVVFAPLVVLLAMQLLGLIAKPDAGP